MAKHILVMMVLWHFILALTSAFAVSPEDIVRLKSAGVSDRLVKEIISLDAISRALISVDEIVKMKDAKIGDEIILAIIEHGSATATELDIEAAADRVLKRRIKRQEIRLEMQKRELDVLVQYLSRLITHPEIIKLVNEGKLAGEDYASIVKYLKQYARVKRPWNLMISFI